MKTPHLISHLLQTGCFLINQKKRMPTPFTTVQHCTGGLNQRNRSIQINKGCSNWKGRHKSFWTVVLERTLESPLDCKEIQPVHPNGDQPWDFFGENDAKAETPVLWPPHTKSWLIGKDFDVGRDWGQEEKGTTKDEMAGWHHWLDEHESEWTPGIGDGEGALACCDSWGRKELDTTEQLNWTELINGKM